MALSAAGAAPARVLATLGKPGTFRGGCPKAACHLSFTATKHKITRLSYRSRRCGGQSNISVAIKISKGGKFYDSPPPPVKGDDFVLKGQFTSPTVATGKLVVAHYKRNHFRYTCRQSGHFTVTRR